MAKLKNLFLWSLMAMGVVCNARAQVNSSMADAHKLIRDKITCDKSSTVDSPADCNEVNNQFELLKKSNNLELIYEIYQNEKVQMEMEYQGHGTRR